MIPTQNFENYPEFANAGQKSQPNDAKYAAGFIPSDVLPAEWLNWFLNGATKGVTALNTGVKSVEQEINAVLASRSVTPDINAAGQLLAVLNKIKAEAVLAAHPVGSLYWTSKNENPAVTFGGGTWKQITDKFVLAAGSTYKAETTGGAATVTLTTSNMPRHSHSFTPSGTIKMDAHSHGLNGHTHSFTPSGTVSSSFTGTSTTTGNMSKNATGDFESLVRSVLTVAASNTDIAAWKTSQNDGNASYVSGCFSIGDDKFSSYGINNDPPWRPDHIGTIPPNARGCLHIDVSHTHNITASGTVSSSFTGTAGTTDGNSNSTTSVTSTGSFSGSADTTGTSGSGTAFRILPPYVVKYCWERTA